MEKNKKTLTVLLVIFLFFVGSYMLYNQNSGNGGLENRDTKTEELTTQYSTEEKTENEILAPKTDQNNEQDNNQNGEKLSVPGITYAGPLSDGSGYLIEAIVNTDKNGQCELLLVGPEVITRTNSTVQRPSYKQCDSFNFSKNVLSPGEWTAKVKFNFEGESSEYSKERVFKVQ